MRDFKKIPKVERNKNNRHLLNAGLKHEDEKAMMDSSLPSKLYIIRSFPQHKRKQDDYNRTSLILKFLLIRV